MYYIARVLTAIILCVFLAKLNLWVSPIENSVFVFCYRIFIALSPLCLLIFKEKSTSFTLLISLIGILIMFKLPLIAMIIIPFGFSISGYLLKVGVAGTPDGASNYKIAANIGCLLSGLALFVFADKNIYFYMIFSIALIGISALCTWKKKLTENELKIAKNNNKIAFSLVTLGWIFLGIATGIKFTAMFSVLPQVIIGHIASLPNWYGIIIALNCVLIICLQKHVMKFMKKFSIKAGIFPLFCSMAVIGLTQYFHVENFFGALIWITLLSALEASLSYLDTLSTLRGSLLLKETFVGLGGFLTVIFARQFQTYGAPMLGMIGIIIALAGLLMILSHENKRALH